MLDHLPARSTSRSEVELLIQLEHSSQNSLQMLPSGGWTTPVADFKFGKAYLTQGFAEKYVKKKCTEDLGVADRRGKIVLRESNTVYVCLCVHIWVCVCLHAPHVHAHVPMCSKAGEV